MQQNTKNNEVNTVDEKSSSRIKLSYGNSLIIDNITNEVVVLTSRNEIQLRIQSTKDGLIVNLSAEKLQIQAAEEINFTSKKISIEATEQIKIKSRGNLISEVGKDALTEVGGTNKSKAAIQKIAASLGNIELKANDYVKLDGESVLLNCEE